VKLDEDLRTKYEQRAGPEDEDDEDDEESFHG
jgi:hypothetical protein